MISPYILAAAVGVFLVHLFVDKDRQLGARNSSPAATIQNSCLLFSRSIVWFVSPPLIRHLSFIFSFRMQPNKSSDRTLL